MLRLILAAIFLTGVLLAGCHGPVSRPGYNPYDNSGAYYDNSYGPSYLGPYSHGSYDYWPDYYRPYYWHPDGEHGGRGQGGGGHY